MQKERLSNLLKANKLILRINYMFTESQLDKWYKHSDIVLYSWDKLTLEEKNTIYLEFMKIYK